jgi:hypothetical protein
MSVGVAPRTRVEDVFDRLGLVGCVRSRRFPVLPNPIIQLGHARFQLVQIAPFSGLKKGLNASL